MKISSFLVGIIFAIIIIIAGFSWFDTNLENTGYSDSEIAILNNATAKIDDIQATSGNLSSVLTTDADSGTVTTLGALNTLYQTAWGTMKQIPNYLGFVNDMMKSIAAIVGVDDTSTMNTIITLIWSALIITIVFVVISAIFQKDL